MVRVRTFFSRIVLILAFSLALPALGWAKAPPDEMLKHVTQDLISALRSQDQSLQEHPDKIYAIINQILVPHVEWHAMSQWVVGRVAWAKASDKDKEAFASEFKDLLIRTYASTLQAYNNQTIEYLPIRGGVAGKKRVQVVSRIRESGREPIQVTYRLVDQGDDWKVYDIIIEGVSLLKGFQSQFSEEVQQQGLEPLIKRLHTHNEKPLR